MPNLNEVNDFRNLIIYLADKLGWPVNYNSFDDLDELTFEYDPEELGIPPELCAKVRQVKQMRPLIDSQPWAVFYLSFETKRLPVTALRRILNAFVEKKRAASGDRATWKMQDLLFVNSHGDDENRAMTFAHFTSPETGYTAVMREFMWSHRETHLAHIERYLECLQWPEEGTSHQVWRKQWRSAFVGSKRKAITDSRALAEEMAHFAYEVRHRVSEVLELTRKKQTDPLQQLYASFQNLLIHNLEEDDFADAYAQTMAYGLFAARAAKPDDEFSISTAPDKVPPTNPFLRGLFRQCLGLVNVGAKRIDIEELGVRRLVELFISLQPEDMKRIMDEFGSQTGDPVIHFYEDFLSAYDKAKKLQRGVFYTPKPVVSNIVHSVHELLQTEFGLEDGLASTVTWGEMVKRFPDLKLPKILVPQNGKSEDEEVNLSPDEYFVMILDIATGTGTFLVEIIDVIHKIMKIKWQKQGKREQEIIKLWNEYVPKHLLPRLYGYELMMAPYTIAHMKIGLKLSETGYQFMSDKRVRVYLTNTLEPPSGLRQVEIGKKFLALAHEAEEVNAVKRNVRFTVVVGNPPYSHWSANLGTKQRELVEAYKYVRGERIRERGALQFELNIQDDYIKFIRITELAICSAGTGLIGLITNNAYLDSATFRGLRVHLLDSFTLIQILNLHGSVKAARLTKDENVFDIQQGVAIVIATKHASGNSGLMDYGELVGLREMKYRTLMNVLTHIPTSSIKPHAPDYLFLYRDETLAEEYEAGIAVDNIFSLSSSGVKTNRDGLTIAFNQTELDQRQAIFFGKGLSDADVAKALVIQNKKYWNVRDARKALSHQEWSDSCTTVEYRPFDQRRIVYHPALVFSTRKPVMVHLGCRENIALLFCRQQIVTGFSHVFATRNMFDCCLVSNRSRENTSGFPLYLVDSDDLFLVESARLKRNLTKQAIDIFQQAFGKIRDEEILYYIYAILHSPQYRKRYSEFLRRDFPRVPLTSNLVLHQSLAKLGNELVALHLLESTKVNDFITCFVGNGDNSISRKPTWENNTVWINSTQCFRGVPENVWNFYIGCYQVCEKWLKDRKGRTLSADDITHYQRIVVALSETIRLMGEIDGVIEQHGGWPDAFVQQKDIAIEPDRTAGVDIAVTSSELFPKDSEFVAPNPSHILKAAETEVEPLKTDRTDAHDAGQNKPDEPDIEEIILLIRQLFSDGNVRVRDDAINELAQNLGYQRTGHRIYEGLDNNLRTAVRRGIIENRDNGLAILARSIEDYDRDFLKDQFLASLQGVRWEERDEAVRDFARWMGFRRTGLAIDETARSLINGLIREGRLESEGQQIRKIR